MKYHDPVLLRESVDGLEIKPEGIYVDVTFGGGGHSREILEQLTTGKLFAFDKDQDSMSNVPDNKNFKLIASDFRDVQTQLAKQSVDKIDGLLADLGISSHQIDQPSRGFSTRFDSELDMRMDVTSALTASQIVNGYEETELANIFWLYGELKQSRPMAKTIVLARAKGPITTTEELKSLLVKFAKKGKEKKFCAQVFQALRIEVNDELNALKELLEQSVDLLNEGGRLSVISYHSLEDRLVKNFIAKGKFEGELEKDFYGNPLGYFRSITRKPIKPKEEEVEMNTRARSAKLRIAEKI